MFNAFQTFCFAGAIPGGVSKLKKLTVLNATGNKLKTLPTAIHKATGLETCVASKNRIKKLPKNIGQAPNLTNLNVSENVIKSLPKSIYRLPNALDASGNLIENLPDIVISKKSKGNIISMNLSHNLLSRLPEDIDKLKKLHRLDVSHNNITELPQCKFVCSCFHNRMVHLQIGFSHWLCVVVFTTDHLGYWRCL